MLHVGSVASNTNIRREDTAAFYNKSYTSVGPSLPKNFAEDCFYYGRKVNEDMEIPFTDAEEVITICREINVLQNNSFLCHSQDFSKVSTIADLTDDLFKAINKGNITLTAFIDLKKAFDKVDNMWHSMKETVYGWHT